ncbi:hypothetical protein CHS0354_041697 [Potamilus streckersoni]|uniref:Uncharacterized protein n=1 Tax=Potamilus streckersoni TaxID=2493646 RepID=A0AAE0T0Z0_9BIVA|nr:hypothetical protein CHS0354_041697 [Potamilus streckersoni]
MAAKRPKDEHKEHEAKIERELLPAVQLEKKEIRLKMSNPPLLPSRDVITPIIHIRPENGSGGADQIVGKEAESLKGMQQEMPERTSELTVKLNGHQESSSKPSPRPGSRPISSESGKSTQEENTLEIMEFFEKGEKTFHQHLHAMQRRHSNKKIRSPSQSPVRQSIGLDHLDNLVRLMEQLSSLRDENMKLKKKCAYLESTKTLLQVKSSFGEEGLHDIFPPETSEPTKLHFKSHSEKVSHSKTFEEVKIRPRLPSAEDAEYIEFLDSNSDQSPKRPKNSLHKRSFSTGSLEIPSDILEQSEGDDEKMSKSYEKSVKRSRAKISKSPESKGKSKFSKWAKVKKVLTGQQLSENISSGIKSIKELGKGSYFRYGPVTCRELTVPVVTESRSVDSGVGSGMDAEVQDVRKSTSSGDPPSPTGFTERHIDVPDTKYDLLSAGIWMGPPEWIEKQEMEEKLKKEKEVAKQHERKDSQGSDTRGDESMQFHLSQSETMLNDQTDQLLMVPIVRRQSSPSLLDDATGEEEEEEDAQAASLHRSSSYRERIMEQDEVMKEADSSPKLEKEKKLHRTPWGRVKDIITTRRDSVKKKSGRKVAKADFEGEEISERDFEDDRQGREDIEGPVSRSTPKTSPVVFRHAKQTGKSTSLSPPDAREKPSPFRVPISGVNVDVSTLLGGVSDEFTRKLQEWEELKGKKTTLATTTATTGKGMGSPGKKRRDGQMEQDGESSSEESMDEITTPPEQRSQSISVEEMQRKLTDSFSRKMQDWERRKYRRDTAQSIETKESSSHVTRDRQKSKKSKEEKEREKLEKMRERELQRVEREEHKLEKERIRIEKERLKALEREAKIEKMKGRLSQPDMESKYKNPILSPLTEYKVTSDFARKLHEWEMRRGRALSTAMYIEAQQRSQQFAKEYRNAASILKMDNGAEKERKVDQRDEQERKTSDESDDNFFIPDEPAKDVPTPAKVRGQKPPPLTLIPCIDSPEEVSPATRCSDDSSLDDTTIDTVESMTQSNISSLEKANYKLLEELRQQELEYIALQEEVRDLNEKLSKFREEHAKKLERYKLELLSGKSGQVAVDTKQMTTTLRELEHKILELKNFGEKLAMSMESTAIGKFQTVEGEESINNRLVELLDQMRVMLHKASLTEEESKKSSALHNFEKLYSQAMQLQVQMNNLRLSQLERNKELMTLKRHLLLQEASNLLLQSDIAKREAELFHYKEYSRKGTPIKRWNTYSGEEDRQRMFLSRLEGTEKGVPYHLGRTRESCFPVSYMGDSDSDQDIFKPEIPASGDFYRRQSNVEEEGHKSLFEQTTDDSAFVADFPEPSTDHSDEHLKNLQQQKEATLLKLPQVQEIDQSFEVVCTVTLPTACICLPKDISHHELKLPRSHREKSHSPPSDKKFSDRTRHQEQFKKEDKVSFKEESIETIQKQKIEKKQQHSTISQELLIPEWKKKTERGQLHRMKAIYSDDVFEPSFSNLTPVQVKLPASEKKNVAYSKSKGISYDSNESSDDTIKLQSPAESPILQLRSRVLSAPESSRAPWSPMIASKDKKETSIKNLELDSSWSPKITRKPPLQQRQGRKLNISITPLRRIVPAQELWEESQRYRSGHSIYLSRILKTYPLRTEIRSRSLEERDKENIKVGYVKSIVEQLSREGTPEQRTSNSTPTASSLLTLHRADSPRSQSEFVSTIVRKLSQPVGPIQSKYSTPLADLTNGVHVKKIAEVFTYGSSSALADRTHSDMEYSQRQYSNVGAIPRDRRSYDITKFYDSSSSVMSSFTISQLSTKTEPVVSKTDSSVSETVTFSSMPLLLEDDGGADVLRVRALTSSGATIHDPGYHSSRHASTEVHMSVGIPQTHYNSDEISHIPGGDENIQTLSPEPVAHKPPHSPPSPKHKHSQSRTHTSKKSSKSKMETIGALCKQSMTFDLGITLQVGDTTDGDSKQSIRGIVRQQTQKSTDSHSKDPSISSQLEGEIMPVTEEIKKKSKHKFMDYSLIQKSRRFFKVSKS